jgi:type IV pilus assembly protein PilB
MDAAMRSVLAALRKRGLSTDAIDSAVATSARIHKPLRKVLVDDQVVTEFELASATADAYGLEAVELSNFPVEPAAMARIPLAMARRHRMLPIAISESTISVAVVDPGDVLALDDVRTATGMNVRPLVVTSDDFNRLLGQYTRQSTDLTEAAAQGTVDNSNPMSAQQLDVDEDVPVVRFVESLLERAINSRASDIHLEPNEAEMRVRLRIDGVLHEIDAVPLGVQSALISRLKILSGLDITERRVPQNGRISRHIGGRAVDVRSATLPTVWGEKVVLRVLDTGGLDLELRKLGFTEHNYDRFSASFRKPHGMVLVTGPTGSGKSTSLYATLTEISRPEINVITVEDPVEYRISGVNQIQVNPKAGVTFAAVLPAILRSDPDVVLIGEIRDAATAQIAIEAALTGHLVLSTLHTNDAPSALPRLVDMGIEPFLVGSALDCVLGQRLARKLCEWCKEAYEPSVEELQSAQWPLESLGAPHQLWRPIGCRSCATTGYRGRLALNEVMPVSEEIERLAVSHASASDIGKIAIAEGMITLREDGLRKAGQGLTSLAEVIRVTA